MPTVPQALQRLDNEMAVTGSPAPGVLILIHGYGSSGRGGAIRKEVRRRLDLLAERRQVGDLLRGENIDHRSGRCRSLRKRFPCLRAVLRRANPGITIVVL
jgi:hypothetical protein